MGVLDEAIREHLDLKRARGADPTEIERLEREALGPVRREPLRGGLHFDDAPEPNRDDGSVREADAHTEYHDSTAPHWQGDHYEEHLEPVNGLRGDRVEPEQPKRRGFLRRRGGSSHEPERQPVVEPEHFWPEHYDEPDHLEPEHDEPEHFPEGHFEPERLEGEHQREPVAHSGDTVGFPHDEGPATELHHVADVEPLTHPLDEPSDAAAPTPKEPESTPKEPESLVAPEVPVNEPKPPREAEPELEHPLGPIEPAAAEPIDPAAAEPVEPVPAATPRKAPPGPAIEARPQGSSATPPPLHFENPPRRPRFSTDPPGLEPSGSDSPGDGREELQRTTEFDVQEHMEGDQLDEDVLEETPEFLQDTPEHDRLWFEQRPPRDFDFDG